MNFSLSVRSCVPLLTLLSAGAPLLAQQRIDIQAAGQPDTIEIVQISSIGSLDDEATAFGQIMDAKFGPNRSIYVVDMMNYRVRRYSYDGELLATIGRRGNGPGEFQLPWKMAVNDHDTLAVWDQRHLRFSIFDPEGELGRTFNVPARWNVSSIHHIAGDTLVVAGFGSGSEHGIHVLSVDGDIARSFGAVDVDSTVYTGFMGSLAGGHSDVHSGIIVYGQKSPFRLDFYSVSGKLLRSCTGPSDWTTQQRDGWRNIPGGVQILWDQYKHLGRVFMLDADRVLTITSDPANERSILRIVGSDCALQATGIEPQVYFMDRSGDYVLAVPGNTDYPEVRVVELRVRRRG
jgi:hypothetical protein